MKKDMRETCCFAISMSIVPVCGTLLELLNEYVNLYGKTKWPLSV